MHFMQPLRFKKRSKKQSNKRSKKRATMCCAARMAALGGEARHAGSEGAGHLRGGRGVS